MPEAIQPGKWYLLRLAKLEKKDDKKPFVAILFEVADGSAKGATFSDNFYLTEKAISRFELLAHRAGWDGPIKTVAAVDDLKLFAAIMGKRVYGLVVKDERYGLRVEGWNFRAQDDPPESEALFVDYAQQDEWDKAMDGL